MNELNYKICDQCGRKMILETTSRVFRVHGKELEIRGIEVYKCEECEEIVFSSKELRMIDKLIHAFDDQPTPDVLNLDETAEFLRVSNQTVYNMIRDGRIKAYKIGREWRFLRGDIMAYLESTSNANQMSLAAKGGIVDEHDLEIINQEMKKRKDDNQ